MIVAEKVSKLFSNSVALKDVNFTVERDEKVAVIGKNGAGKTTLLKIIAGILKPSSGKMMVFNSDPNRDPEVRRKIGVVLNNPMLYNELTVEENLKFFAKIYGCELNKEVLELLEIKKVMKKRVYELSTGWIKRVSIVRALIHDPEVVLIDELPALDFESRSKILDVLQGYCLVYVTHELKDLTLFERFLVLRDGKLVYDGKDYEEAITFYRGH